MKAFARFLPVLILLGATAFASVKSGNPAPDFKLTDTTGKEHSLTDYKGKFVVLEWINHGCPFVKKHYKSGNMQKLQKDFAARDVIWLSICSSAKGRQGYMTSEEWNKTIGKKGSAATAVLIDAEGVVGKLYGAKVTPHMFIISPEGKVIYHGAIDSIASADKDDIAKATNHVKAALEESVAGKPVTTPFAKPYGCSVKYK
jgi:peroxiredoxin